MTLILLLLAYQLDPQAKASVIDAFKKLERFEVRFEQEIFSDFFEESVVEGYLLVARPGKMRMEYQKGDRKTFIWDGETCYERDMLADTENRLAQKDVQDEPLVRLLLYGSDLDALFLIDRYKDEIGEVYRFRPRNGDNYQVEVIFDALWLPKFLEILGDDGEGSRFHFRHFNLNPEFSSNVFTVPAEKEAAEKQEKE